MTIIRAVYTGSVLPSSVRYGTLAGFPGMAVCWFRLAGDVQIYPLFAKGMAAIALRRYVQVISQYGRDGELKVSVEVELIGADYLTMALAAKIHWHVFGSLRDVAEDKIRIDKRHLFDNVGLPPDWPRAELAISRQAEGGVAVCPPKTPGHVP